MDLVPPFDIQWQPPGVHVVPAIDEEGWQAAGYEIAIASPRRAEILNCQLQELRARAHSTKTIPLPYLDLDHDFGDPLGFPVELWWGGEDRERGGIRAAVVWTEEGKKRICSGQRFRFSQATLRDPVTRNESIDVNMGGLLTERKTPAFKASSPVLPISAASAGSMRSLFLNRADEIAKCCGVPLISAAGIVKETCPELRAVAAVVMAEVGS